MPERHPEPLLVIEAITGNRHRLIFVANRKTRIFLGAVAIAMLLNNGSGLVERVLALLGVISKTIP